MALKFSSSIQTYSFDWIDEPFSITSFSFLYCLFIVDSSLLFFLKKTEKLFNPHFQTKEVERCWIHFSAKCYSYIVLMSVKDKLGEMESYICTQTHMEHINAIHQHPFSLSCFLLNYWPGKFFMLHPLEISVSFPLLCWVILNRNWMVKCWGNISSLLR
jgi:hypothetical protein